MKIMLTKPFPQPTLGKIIPAGVIIDAPAGLSEHLVATKRAKPVRPGQTGSPRIAKAPKSKPAKRKVKNRV